MPCSLPRAVCLRYVPVCANIVSCCCDDKASTMAGACAPYISEYHHRYNSRGGGSSNNHRTTHPQLSLGLQRTSVRRPQLIEHARNVCCVLLLRPLRSSTCTCLPPFHRRVTCKYQVPDSLDEGRTGGAGVLPGRRGSRRDGGEIRRQCREGLGTRARPVRRGGEL